VTLLNRITANLLLMLQRPPQQQYAALCYRSDPAFGLQVLLLTSRETRRWVIPKGWPMKNKKGHAVAEQEAYEEAGVRGKAGKDPIGFYGYMKKRKSGLKVPVKVRVYPLRVDEMLVDFPERESRTLEWVSCSEAATRVHEPELRNLFLDFSRRAETPVKQKLRAVGR
jgi:8-oxo-dGTP pyrophosphatase MutT (NUDIX family)